jgi:hypothetical protein
MCGNIERKEERTIIRRPQPLPFHLMVPSIDLLSGDLVALRHLRDRRIIYAQRLRPPT